MKLINFTLSFKDDAALSLWRSSLKSPGFKRIISSKLPSWIRDNWTHTHSLYCFFMLAAICSWKKKYLFSYCFTLRHQETSPTCCLEIKHQATFNEHKINSHRISSCAVKKNKTIINQRCVAKNHSDSAAACRH